jgi:hypothetical protein
VTSDSCSVAKVEPVASDTGERFGSIDAGFPWGLLVVTDPETTEQIPAFANAEEQITSSATTVVIRVEHEQEGLATVHVYKHSGDLGGNPVFDGTIRASNETLTVGDALAERLIRVSVEIGMHRLRVFLNRPANATHVDVVLD